ncbi:alanine--tRNA ligase [Candidatus Phytoplasma australiense]|uniref:Alanine--tRNA ligase n=1 Tax=Strawberry lethal yellows phytoplasma (CPA) str. NZSb11 TaxID=980422 RepID=R4RWH1_PHYAS|nr:alanine--tRNA ligase [Candidatus Phytoplasma australiense]AGL90217.1 Alanyl-tRNA synthetase [Strawberry lethal yellows phytoplasma (CPA) str. NZSb11]
MKSFAIRKMWLDFFSSKGHHIEKSFSLIPHQDPTLLWVNAGVTPLKKYFDGSQTPLCKKIVNVQKCIRTNDIENVGETARHHTFFEMLGNFSIGDYFKKEAIHYAYELLTSSKWFSFPLDKLYITYYPTDKDTYKYWLELGIRKDRLIPLKSNFWQIGPGPSGPCTEIFFDRGEKYDKRNKELIIEDLENNRFIEIWNIVFSQYNCDPKLSIEQYQELPNKNIDTGAGLERLAAILQEADNNFETDLFFPLIKSIAKLSQIPYHQSPKAFKIIADHLKTLVFAINDGATLTNEKRGYVLKKLLRRSFIQGKKLNFNQPFLHNLVDPTINMMQDFYPELTKNKNYIKDILLKQEHVFLETLKTAEAKFLYYAKKKSLSGINFFKLYDTYGIPEDVIIDYAKINNVSVDYKGFKFLLEKHRQISQKNHIFISKMNQQEEKFLNFREKSEFVGYNNFALKTKVIKVFDKGIVLAQTPFYAPMGGQIADEGFIDGKKVKNITKLPNGQHLHQIEGSFYEGQEVFAQIDKKVRDQISYHHTATHLLETVLQNELGSHLEKQGSSVGYNSLRYDFNHFEKLTPEKLIKIEKEINGLIKKNLSVEIQKIPTQEAKENYSDILSKNPKAKYKDEVRIVRIGNDFSIDLCGGTHASETKNLEKFVILSYETISSGIYRIEAVCGNNIKTALVDKLKPYQLTVKQLIQKAQTKKLFFEALPVPQINQSYQDILDYQNYLKELQKQIFICEKKDLEYRCKKMIQEKDKFLPEKISKETLIIIEEDINMEVLKCFMDNIFDTLKIDILFICQLNLSKVVFLCKSKTWHAGKLVKEISSLALGSGGGNAFLAQGGSKTTQTIKQTIKTLKNKFKVA